MDQPKIVMATETQQIVEQAKAMQKRQQQSIKGRKPRQTGSRAKKAKRSTPFEDSLSNKNKKKRK
jgi:hypothetical protein